MLSISVSKSTDFTHRSCLLFWLACPAAHNVTHGRINREPLGIVDIFVDLPDGCKSTAASSCHKLMLFIAAPATVAKTGISHFG